MVTAKLLDVDNLHITIRCGRSHILVAGNPRSWSYAQICPYLGRRGGVIVLFREPLQSLLPLDQGRGEQGRNFCIASFLLNLPGKGHRPRIWRLSI